MIKIQVLLIMFTIWPSYSQKDTLTYNDIIVYKDSKGSIIYNKGQQSTFTGNLLFESDDKICFQKVKDGKIIKENCKDKTNIVTDDFETLKKKLYKYEVLSYADLKIDSVFVKSQLRQDSDYIESRYIKKFIHNSKTYTGIVKSNDSIFFIDNGDIRIISTIYDNGQER